MRRIALIAWLLLWPAAGFAQDVVQGTTPGGIRYALAPRPAAPLAVLSFAWRDGFGWTQPGREGLSGIAASWVAAAPQGQSEAEFREDLRDEAIGLSLGSFNGQTVGSLSAPPDRVEGAAERLRSVLMQPALNEATLARFKRQRRAALAQARETPAAAARSLAVAMVAGETPVSLEHLAPARSTVADVTRADVEAWRTAVLARDNLVVAAAGPLAEPDLVRLVDRIFGDLPERSAVPGRPTVELKSDARTVVVERSVAQTTLVLAGPTRLDPRDADTGILAGFADQILSSGPRSRLDRVVRGQLGASYGSSADLVTVGGTARILLISSAVEHTLAARALAVLRDEYAALRRDGVTAAELAPLRARAAAGLEEALGRSEIAARLRAALSAGRDPGEVAAGPARAAAATPEAVNAMLAGLWPAPPLATVVVAPSAEGFQADCVVRRDQPIEACLAP